MSTKPRNIKALETEEEGTVDSTPQSQSSQGSVKVAYATKKPAASTTTMEQAFANAKTLKKGPGNLEEVKVDDLLNRLSSLQDTGGLADAAEIMRRRVQAANEVIREYGPAYAASKRLMAEAEESGGAEAWARDPELGPRVKKAREIVELMESRPELRGRAAELCRLFVDPLAGVRNFRDLGEALERLVEQGLYQRTKSSNGASVIVGQTVYVPFGPPKGSELALLGAPIVEATYQELRARLNSPEAMARRLQAQEARQAMREQATKGLNPFKACAGEEGKFLLNVVWQFPDGGERKGQALVEIKGMHYAILETDRSVASLLKYATDQTGKPVWRPLTPPEFTVKGTSWPVNNVIAPALASWYKAEQEREAHRVQEEKLLDQREKGPADIRQGEEGITAFRIPARLEVGEDILTLVIRGNGEGTFKVAEYHCREGLFSFLDSIVGQEIALHPIRGEERPEDQEARQRLGTERLLRYLLKAAEIEDERETAFQIGSEIMEERDRMTEADEPIIAFTEGEDGGQGMAFGFIPNAISGSRGPAVVVLQMEYPGDGTKVLRRWSSYLDRDQRGKSRGVFDLTGAVDRVIPITAPEEKEEAPTPVLRAMIKGRCEYEALKAAEAAH